MRWQLGMRCQSRICSVLRPVIAAGGHGSFVSRTTLSRPAVRQFSSNVISRSTKHPDEQRRESARPELVAEYGENLYPRLPPRRDGMSILEYCQRIEELLETKSSIILEGRIRSIRTSGEKLAFVDLIAQGCKVQLVCNGAKLAASEADKMHNIFRALRRGDMIAVRGFGHRDKTGNPSLMLNELPLLLAPAIHPIPERLDDPERRIRHRHLDMLVNPRPADLLRLRSEVLTYLRQFLLQDGAVEVQTPLLASQASGAIARPFRTFANEFPNKEVALRIAPELWLKRLVIGGLDRVFEIGPCFRNEGIDGTHNPEFTSCEYYRAYAEIEELVGMTERLLSGLHAHLTDAIKDRMMSLSNMQHLNFRPPYQRLHFIPALEEALDQPLPDLDSPIAPDALINLCAKKGLKIDRPAARLPQILDKMAGHFLESKCKDPTFLMYHPACLSPLAKSFPYKSPRTGQVYEVAARAELFVQGAELANMYEEENSPTEQRRKFEQQRGEIHGNDAISKSNLTAIRGSEFVTAATQPSPARDDSEAMAVDESYLDALGHGLPPTGGFGLGVDRLVMLLAGTTRIADVLSFGTLRNVMALHSRSSSGKSPPGE